MRKALITGINGQDGSYLADLLIHKGYQVHGIVRREALEDPSRRMKNISHIIDKIILHVSNLDNHLSIFKLLKYIKPDECYHLASSSFVNYLFEEESSLLSNNFNSTHSLLGAIKEVVPNCRVYYAGSSEMFGDVLTFPQNESTSFNPRSVYGISKISSISLGA